MEAPKSEITAVLDFPRLQDLSQRALGPYLDPRIGDVVALNLLHSETKCCTFNCIQCPMGETKVRISQMKKEVDFPSFDQIKDAFMNIYEKNKNQSLNLLIIGTGEPTLHPHFDEISYKLKSLLHELRIKWPMFIQTNGTTLRSKKIVQALQHFDYCLLKMDVGSEDLFQLFNRPLVRTEQANILSWSRKLSNVIVQARFFQGACSNFTKEAIEEWIESVGLIHPLKAQIYTITQSSGPSSISPVAARDLYRIAQMIKQHNKFPVEVFC